MLKIAPPSPSDFHMIKKELETVGELLNSEQLERKAGIDKLMITVEALKRTLSIMMPGFTEQYRRTYEDSIQAFDPERNQASSR